LFAEPPARFKGKSTENYAVLHGDLIKMSEIGFLQGKITYDILTAFSHPSPTSLEIWSISMLSILSGNYTNISELIPQ